jgi:hypothetical protein
VDGTGLDALDGQKAAGAYLQTKKSETRKSKLFRILSLELLNERVGLLSAPPPTRFHAVNGTSSSPALRQHYTLVDILV